MLDAPDFKPLYPLDGNSRFFATGSCFSTQIARRLEQYGYAITSNPRGTVYHPLAMARMLKDYLDDAPWDQQKLFEHQGIWRHWEFHSDQAQHDKEQAIAQLNASQQDGRKAIALADVLILTWGTAWEYVFREGGFPVANCHTVPAHQFDTRIASIEELVNAYRPLLDKWLSEASKPQRQVFITLSPVRYTRHGLMNDRRSKARLLEAMHQLADYHQAIQYVPVYEWITDVLRDYRFFQEDLVHPTDQAVDWIWARWQSNLFHADERSVQNEAEALLQFLRHKPRQPKNAAYLSALDKMRDRYMEWKRKAGRSLPLAEQLL